MVLLHISDECIEGDIYWVRVEGVKVTDDAKVTKMAEMAKMFKVAQMTARHVIHPVAENAKKSKMPEMSIMTARHVMCSLGGPAV
jgi:hypothetical protein